MDKVKPNFLQLNIGHILVITVNIITLAFYFGKQQVVITQESQQRLKLEAKVNYIDVNGPIYGQLIKVKVDSLETRTKLLEDQLPRIITVVADLNNLSRTIDEIKNDIKEIKKNQNKP